MTKLIVPSVAVQSWAERIFPTLICISSCSPAAVCPLPLRRRGFIFLWEILFWREFLSPRSASPVSLSSSVVKLSLSPSHSKVCFRQKMSVGGVGGVCWTTSVGRSTSGCRSSYIRDHADHSLRSCRPYHWLFYCQMMYLRLWACTEPSTSVSCGRRFFYKGMHWYWWWWWS